MAHGRRSPLELATHNEFIVDAYLAVEDRHFLVNHLKIKVEELELRNGSAVRMQLKAVFSLRVVRLHDPEKCELLLIHVKSVRLICELFQRHAVPLLDYLAVDLYLGAQAASIVLGQDLRE